MQGGNNNSRSSTATTQGIAATVAGGMGGVSAATDSSSNGVAVCLLTDETKSNINACLEVFDNARRELDERNWGFAAKDAEFNNTARGVALATVAVGQLACSVALQFPQLLSDVSDALPKAMANTSGASRESTQNSQLLNIKDFLANIQSLNKAITHNFARPDAGEPAGERVETGFANMHGEAHANIVSASANLLLLGSGLVVFPEAAALLTDMVRYTVNEVSQIGALGTDAVSELSPLLTKISQAKDIQAKLKSINGLIDKMSGFLSENHDTDVAEKLSVDTKKQQATGAAVAKTAGVSAVLTLAASLKTISQALLAGHILAEARGSCVTNPDITTQGSNVDKDELVVTREMHKATNANIQDRFNDLGAEGLKEEDQYAVEVTVEAGGAVAKGSAAVVGSATAVSAVPSQQFQMTGLSSKVSSHVLSNDEYRTAAHVAASDDASKLEANHSAVISAWCEVLDKTTKQIKAGLDDKFKDMAEHHKSTIGTEAKSTPVTAMLASLPYLIIHQVSAIVTRESLGGAQASKLSHEESINPDNSEKSKTKQTGQCLDAALARSIGEFTKQLKLAQDNSVISPVICGLLGRIVVTGISLAVADAASTAVSMIQQTGLHTTDVTQRLGNATNKSMAPDQPDDGVVADDDAGNQAPLLPAVNDDKNDFDAEGRLKERLASAPDSTAKTSPGLAPDQGEITAGNNCTRETILYILRSENAASEQLRKSREIHDHDGGVNLNASAGQLDDWLRASIVTGSVGLTLGGGVGGATLLSGTVFSGTVAFNAAAIMLKNAVAKVCNPEHAVHKGPDRFESGNGSNTDTNPSASMNASRISTHHSSNGNPDTLSAALVTPQLLELVSSRFVTVIISQNQALSKLVTDECKDAKGLDKSLQLAIRSVNEECSEQLTDKINEALLAEDEKPAAEADDQAEVDAKNLKPFYNKLINDMASQLGSSAMPSIASFVLSNVATIMPLAIAWRRCKAGYADSQAQKEERLSGVSGFDSVSKISNIMQNFTRVAAELDYGDLDNLEKNQNSSHAATGIMHTGSEAASSIELHATRLGAELLEMSISRSMTLLDYQAIAQAWCNLSVKLKDVSSQLVSLVALQVENDTAQANPESSKGAGSQTIGSISALRSTVTRLVNASNELSLQLFHLQTELQKAALDIEKLQGCNGTRNGNDEKLHTVQTAMMRAASALTLLASQSITALPMLLSLPVNSSLATMKAGPLAKTRQKSKQGSASVRYQDKMILAPSTQEQSADDESCAETGSVTRPVVSIIDPMLITAVNVLVTLTISASNVVHQASNSLVSVVDVVSAQDPIDGSTRQMQKMDVERDVEKSTNASIIPTLAVVGENIRQTGNDDDSACFQATTDTLKALGKQVHRRLDAALEGLGDLGPQEDENNEGSDLTKFGYMQHIIAALSGKQAHCAEVKQHAQRLSRGGLKLSQFHSMFNSDHGQDSSTVSEPIKKLQRFDTAENLISHFVSVVVSEFDKTDQSSDALENLKSGIASQGASLDENAKKMHRSILEEIFDALRMANLADRFGPSLDKSKFLKKHETFCVTVPSADADLDDDSNKPSAPPLPFVAAQVKGFDALMQGFDDLMGIPVALPAEEDDLADHKAPMAQGLSESDSADSGSESSEEDRFSGAQQDHENSRGKDDELINSFDSGPRARAGMFNDELRYRSSDDSPPMVLGALPPTSSPSQSK